MMMKGWGRGVGGGKKKRERKSREVQEMHDVEAKVTLQ
jgi:hypothetical protein